MYAVFDGFEGLINNQVRLDASSRSSNDALKILGENFELDVREWLE